MQVFTGIFFSPAASFLFLPLSGVFRLQFALMEVRAISCCNAYSVD